MNTSRPLVRKNKQMNTLRILAICLLATVSVISAKADTAAGSLTVTGTITGSISLTIVSDGPAVTGNGTDAVSNPLGNISRLGAAPAGVDKWDYDEDHWYVSFTVYVRVEKANLVSGAYNLDASLASAPPAGVEFTVEFFVPLHTGSTGISNGYSAQYGWDYHVPIAIIIANDFPGGSIDNTIIYTATAH